MTSDGNDSRGAAALPTTNVIGQMRENRPVKAVKSFVASVMFQYRAPAQPDFELAHYFVANAALIEPSTLACKSSRLLEANALVRPVTLETALKSRYQ